MVKISIVNSHIIEHYTYDPTDKVKQKLRISQLIWNEDGWLITH
ncbi:hypothetical protein [Celerinatantimonas yamalensis]